MGSGAPNWSLSSYQWLGGRFTLDGPTTITGVQGFFGSNQGGTLLAVLHTDVDTLPGRELLSQSFFVTPGAGTDSWQESSGYTYTYGWFGADRLAWEVGPGSYWLTFETPAAGAYSGVMPGGAQLPLELYTHKYWDRTYWMASPKGEYLRLGIRIDGESGTNPSAVPEPGTMMLLGSGFVALAGLGRSRFAVKN